MTTFIHSFCSRHVLCIETGKFKTIKDLKLHLSKEKGFPLEACFFVCNGSLVEDSEPVKQDVTYHTLPRILGGKGGFGSMLRAIGAQIEKTTNHEACRDLSGRRMRDVNNEKELKEWLAKQAEKEREREQRRQERIARRRAMPNHKFDDPLYDQQKSQLLNSQEDALQKGLKRAFQAPSCTATNADSEDSSSSNEGPGPSSSKIRKTTEWLGIDMDNLSDSGESDDEAKGRTVSADSDGASAESMSHMALASSSTDMSESGLATTDGSTEAGATLETAEKTSIKDHEEQTNDEEIESQSTQDTEVDLEDYSGAKDLEVVGLDRLKAALMSRGLKCGGTLQERAERLFSVKGLTQDQIDPALFAKPSKGKGSKKGK